MKRMMLLSLIFGLALATFAACQPAITVPEGYAGMENPYQGDAEAATAGRIIYQNNCIGCHGEDGLGKGTAAANLDPPPPNLIESVERNNDDYLYWRIAEGGRGDPIESSMPAYASTLSEEEIWAVITYIEQIE